MAKKIWGVVGPVGVGKTTLTKTLCEHYNATAIFEEWENNPYLDDFYKSESLLNNQLWFIKNDFERLSKAINIENEIVVVDKLFIQNYSYIQITDFNDFEKEKCFEEYEKGFNLINKVDLIINLRADSSVVKNRIATRNRDLDENVLSEEWLENFQNIQFKYIKSLSGRNNLHCISYINNTFDSSDLIRQIDEIK